MRVVRRREIHESGQEERDTGEWSGGERYMRVAWYVWHAQFLVGN